MEYYFFAGFVAGCFGTTIAIGFAVWMFLDSLEGLHRV